MGKQKFFQEEIYRLNREVRRFSTYEEDGLPIISAFNSSNRAVNYFPVRYDTECRRWSLDNEKDTIEAFLKSKNVQFNRFLDYFEEDVKTRTDDLHAFLINLYNNFPVPPNLFLDGIVRRFLPEFIKKGHLIRYAFVNLLHKKSKELDYNYFPWVDVRFFYNIPPDRHNGMGTIADQEKARAEKYGEWFGQNHGPADEVIANIKQERDEGLHLEPFFFEYLQPLFMGYEKNGEVFGGDDFFSLKEQELIRFEYLLIIPFYDAWLDEKPCGALKGNILIPFEDDSGYKKRIEFIEKHFKRFSLWSQTLNQLLFESRSHSVLRLPVQFGDDSLKDFLSKVAFVQDWEKVRVLHRSKSGHELRYCFKRKETGQWDYRDLWEHCEPGDLCEECLPERLRDVLRGGDKRGASAPDRWDKVNPYFPLDLKDILDPKVLPSIEPGEMSSYGDHVLCFEFPKDTYFPEGGVTKENLERLGEYYTEKLIPVFDKILLKNKVIKHSIKSAVAAIIGRNMSHNIGSHVLSYGPASLKTAETNLAQVRFYEYLRQRMDFIAEICTSDPSWCPSMNLIRDILIPFFRQDMLLNYIALSEGVHRDVCEERDCSKNHHNMHFKVLIGGETCFEAKSQQFFPDPEFSYKLNDEGEFTPEKYFFRSKDPEPLIIRHDIAVSIPHGIIGCHAFYSILENLIRNSAKHGQNWLKKGKGFEIVISIDERNPDFVKLNLTDNMGNCDNQLKDKLSSGLDPSEEPLVDNEGRLNSGNLGLKEMRVCANFLRMRPTNQADVKTPRQSLWSDEALKKPLIEIDCEKKTCSQDRPCENPNLQYALYLFKPKEALVICSDQIIKRMKKEDLDRLQKHGIYFKSMETFKTSHERGFFHRFIAVQSELMGDLMAHVKSQDYQIPLRVVSVDKPDNISVEDLYKKWIKGIDPNFDNLKIAWRGSHSGGIDDIFCTKSKQIPEDTNILFDNHGECNREGDGCIYYQPYRGDERIYRLLYTIAGEKESQRLRYYELIEASVTNVIIADERIWKKTAGDLNFGPQLTRTKREVLNDMRVRLTPIENNRVSLKVIKQFLAKTEKKIPCFFIIHQGIIDKMNDREQKDLDKIIADYQNRLDHFTYIVTSGRGIPDFSHRAKFIEISNLEKFIEERDKYSLVQTLFALRRPQND